MGLRFSPTPSKRKLQYKGVQGLSSWKKKKFKKKKVIIGSPHQGFLLKPVVANFMTKKKKKFRMCESSIGRNVPPNQKCWHPLYL